MLDHWQFVRDWVLERAVSRESGQETAAEVLTAVRAIRPRFDVRWNGEAFESLDCNRSLGIFETWESAFRAIDTAVRRTA